MAPTTYGVSRVSASAAGTTPAEKSPGFSNGSSTASNPIAATLRSRSVTLASVRGEAHTHVLTPISRIVLSSSQRRAGGGRPAHGICRSCQTSG